MRRAHHLSFRPRSADRWASRSIAAARSIRAIVTTHKGIPVTTVHRLIVDLADDVQIPHEVTAVIHEAAFMGRFVELAVRDAMARVSGRRNLHVVDRAIELHQAGSAGIKSRHELAFFLLVTGAGFPEPLVNVHAYGFERDFHWPELAARGGDRWARSHACADP